MNSPIDLTGAVPAPGHAASPPTPEHERIEEQFIPPQPVADFEQPPIADAPVNPYAPVGWKRKERVEFDMTLPSGQLCRVLRLEREDLFRMNLMQYLDTFTPMLMEDAASSEASRDNKIKQTMKDNPDALANMFLAIDEVVMAATVRPKVTNDEKLIDYGTDRDWRNPKFIATAFIGDIGMEDRMAIFAAAFGKSMDDLKSVFDEAGSLERVEDEPSVPQATE